MDFDPAFQSPSHLVKMTSLTNIRNANVSEHRPGRFTIQPSGLFMAAVVFHHVCSHINDLNKRCLELKHESN